MGKTNTSATESTTAETPVTLDAFIAALSGDNAGEFATRLRWLAENGHEDKLAEILAEKELSDVDLEALLDAAGAPEVTQEEVKVVEDPTPAKVEAPAEQPKSSIPSPTDVLGKDDVVAQQPAPSEPIAPRKSVPLIRLSSTLQTYVTEMAVSKPHNATEGADLQRQLFRAIEGIVYAANNDDFVTGMNLLLDTLDEHKTGVFFERYVFRFWEQLSLPRTQRFEFEHLMRLFLTIAPKASRKGAVSKKQLDVGVAHMRSHEHQERLVEYVKRLTSK